MPGTRRHSLSDSQVARAIQGEPDDLEALALAFLPRIYGLSLRLTRREDLAKDATQETYVRVLRALPRLRRRETLDAWILTIASNVVRDLARRRRPEEPLTYEPPALDAERDDWERTRRLAIDHALGELPYEERELFLLHVVEGVRLKHLAQARRQSLSAVTSKMHRIRGKIRASALAHVRAAGVVA